MTLKNTEENAIIELVNRQSSGELSDKIEFVSDCGFYIKNGCFYVTYKEHSDMGMDNSRVIIKLDGDIVTMRRMGEYHTVMVYKTGEVTDFNYHTPFGQLNIKIRTQRIESSFCENGGTLELEYLLFTGGEVTKNEIKINVKMHDVPEI